MYIYDESGSPIGYKYRENSYSASTWDTFWYEKNLQGDVIAIYNNSGTKLASYRYDAWGSTYLSYYNGGASTKATVNPFRYRGYYYDRETCLYYLGSRYYDSQVGRFISADEAGYLGANGDLNSYNLYAYCSNNPVMYSDPSGHFVISISALVVGIVAGAVIGSAISFGATVYQDHSDDGEIFNGSVTSEEYKGNTLGGLIAGAGVGLCSVLGAGLGVSMIAGEALTIGGVALSGTTAFSIGTGTAFATGAAGYAVRVGFNSKESFQLSDMFIEAGANAVSGTISFVGGMAGGITGVNIPGKTNIGNFIKYHAGMTYFGAYPTKFLFSKIKSSLMEKY